jgi:hypothetical protein
MDVDDPGTEKEAIITKDVWMVNVRATADTWKTRRY